MTKTLNIIYADISWTCQPLESIKTNDRHGNHFISGTDVPLKKTNWREVTKNPANENPMFWEHVSRNWFSAFQRRGKGLSEVERYYNMYGPLNLTRSLHPSEQDLQTGRQGLEESWELNERALGWFNLLTRMTEWLKAGNVGPLKNLFGDPRSLENEESISLVFYPEGFEARRGAGRPFYSILWHPYVDPANPLEERLTPQNDYELLQATWYMITEEVEKLLNTIRLSPATVGEHDKRKLTWRFEASGAFEAAFLQWYFRELANFKNEPCANPNCKNLARPGSVYCNRRDQNDKYYLCDLAAAKQRQRFRKREAKRLHAEGSDLKEIIKKIYPLEERQRLEDMNKSPEKIVAGWLKKK